MALLGQNEVCSLRLVFECALQNKVCRTLRLRRRLDNHLWRGLQHLEPVANVCRAIFQRDLLDAGVGALEQAVHQRGPGAGLVHHSDRGSQYVSIKYTERLAEAGIAPSVSGVGDSYDNALAETVIGLFKAEIIHRRGPWRNFESVEYAVLEWVDWFNNSRLLEPIGYIPLTEAEANYYAALDQSDMAA